MTLLGCKDKIVNEYPSYLEVAIQKALTGHYGQVDKGGAPYFLHPLRVMMKMKDYPRMAAAVLHDLVEDTFTTLDDLRRLGMPEEVVEAVDALTKRKGEDYEDYLKRVEANEIARDVKLADLQDNMRLDRLLAVTEKDLKRVAKYKIAYNRLSRA